MSVQRISVARGDGIGPEIVDACLSILKAAGARLSFDEIELGQRAFEAGHETGIPPEAWASIRESQVLLKGPVVTPPGRSNLNISLRKSLGLYANVRPSRSYAPCVATRYPGLDVVIIRENEEDLYGGIEYRQSQDVVQALKLISRPGCERIIRYAFEYARVHDRQKVIAFTKDKIMEFTDGFFHQIFREIAAEYPDLEAHHQSLDTGTAQLIHAPHDYDVIVIPNLYGDIIADIVSRMTTGTVGLGGAANIGENCQIFETTHGYAPAIAQQDMANPSGMIQAAVLMLVHLGQAKVAAQIENAWLCTLEEGLHTIDIYQDNLSRQKMGTRDFAQAVIARLSQQPQTLEAVNYQDLSQPLKLPYQRPEHHKELIGVDIFLDWAGQNPSELAAQVQKLVPKGLQLELITNLGVMVWPQSFPETRLSDQWHCRIQALKTCSHEQIIELLERLQSEGLDCCRSENLYTLDGKPAFSN